MSARVLLLTLLLAAGCDSSGPDPDPAPPAGQAPGDLRIASADPGRIALSWTDRSDDEAAVRVEVATRPFLDRPHGPDLFQTLATLPPGTTAWVDDSLRDVSARIYRVVAVGADDGRDAVSVARAAAFPVRRTRLRGLAGRVVQSVSSSGGYRDLLVVGVDPSGTIGYDWETGQQVGEIADATAVLGPSSVIASGYYVAQAASLPLGATVWVRERLFERASPAESYVLELDPASGCTHTTLPDVAVGLGLLVGRCGTQGVGWLRGDLQPARYPLRPGDRVLGSPFIRVADPTLLIASHEEPTRLVDLSSGELLWQRSTLAQQSHLVHWNGYTSLLLESTVDGVDVVDPATGVLLEHIRLAPAPVRRMSAVAFGRFLAYSVASDPWAVEVGQIGRPHERVRVPLREGHTMAVRNRRLIEFVQGEGAPELWDWRLDDAWQTAAIP